MLLEAQLLHPVQQYAAADPQHGRRADARQRRQQLGHDMDQAPAQRLGRPRCAVSARCRPMSSSFTIRPTTP